MLEAFSRTLFLLLLIFPWIADRKMVAESTPTPASPAHPAAAHRNLASTISSPDQFGRWKSESIPPAAAASAVKSSNGEVQQQPRRCKSREVSSRYMFPTASSIAASAAAVNSNSDSPLLARRSPSPNSHSRRTTKLNSNGNASDQTVSPRSASAERRRPVKTNGENSSDAADALPPGRLRGTVGALWPPSSTSSNYSNLMLQETTLDKARDSNHVKLAAANNNNNNNPEQRRSRTPDRSRTPSRPSTAETNGRRSKENIQINGRPGSSGGHSAAICRASSLRIHSRESSRDSNGGGNVNVENIGSPILPGRLSVDSEYNQKYHQNIILKRRGVRSWSSGQEVDSTASSVTSSDGGGSTPRGSTTATTTTTTTTTSISSTSAASEMEGNSNMKVTRNAKGMKGSYVPARFLQDTLSRLRRLSDAGGHMTSYMQQRLNSSDAEAGNKAFSTTISMSMISPGSAGNGVRGRALQSYNSSSGLRGSAAQGLSPTKSTGGANRMSNMLNAFGGMELFKGSSKRSAANAAAQEEVMHHLRLLQNRWLQWRFINARAEAVHQAQIASAQNSLFNVWCKISGLRSSVVAKRIQLQKARNEEKVNTVVAAHAVLLEDWAMLEEEHTLALTEAMECLDAAIVRVPLVAGAKADVRSVKQVLDFAVHVMSGIQAAASKFLPQAERIDLLLPKLAESVIKERALLQECVELVAGVASLEVEERSLRTHLIQLQQQQQQED